MTIEITKERILEAAAKCSTAKETLKTLFPEVFKQEDEYFDFGASFTIKTAGYSGPLLIGRGVAPTGLKDKCLIVHTDYTAVITEYDGKQIITFKKKS